MVTPTTWIVAADASRARVLQVMDRHRLSEVLGNLLNPGGRLHAVANKSSAFAVVRREGNGRFRVVG